MSSRADDEPHDLASDSPDGRTRRPGVLVVDDDAELVDVLGEALAGRGYRVLRARDGLVAMGDASRDVPGFGPLSSIDVVVTDLVMPGVSGLDLIRHVRAHHPLVPIVAISAFGDEALRSEAIRLGAAMVLHKPFYLEDLIRFVERVAPADGSGCR